MSGADRKAVRYAARDALTAAPYFDGFTAISAWAQSVDERSLPLWAIATPGEGADRVTQGHGRRDLSLILVVKRLGDVDLEDLLDDDADAALPVILAAVRSETRDCEMTRIDMKLDGEGARRIGTLTITFNVTYWDDDPA